MTSTDEQSDLIRRAYANLESLRDNLTPGYVHEPGFYKMYDQALDQLQQAGNDVGEWRIPAGAVGFIDGNEFRAKVDAVLAYFTVQKEQVKIGFRK